MAKKKQTAAAEAADQVLNDLPVDAVAPSKPNDKPRKNARSGQPAAGQLSHFEKYEIIEVHRSQLHKAPYNPRVMSAQSRKKLHDNIQRVGLLEPLIWNKVSGNIVGGHMRVGILDSLHGTPDYRLRVAAVELDSKTEKEQNVFLNNEEAQGKWDMEKLESLFKEDKIDPLGAGYDLGDIYQMFGDNPMIDQPEQLQDLSDKIKQAQERYNSIADSSQERDDVDFFMVVVFASHAYRQQFTDTFDLPDNQFVDGRKLWSFLEISGAIEGQEAAQQTAARVSLLVKYCDRCGCKHETIVFRPLSTPIGEQNYWGLCPEKAEPVFVKHVPADESAAGTEAAGQHG